jgi:phosphate:Na+ symporter
MLTQPIAIDFLTGVLFIPGGLAIFLFGIYHLTNSLKILSSKTMKAFLKKATTFPLFGTLIGAGVTALIQSSSATTVLTVGFVNAGLMTLKQAIGVIFGANIGTTITAQLMAFKFSQFAPPLILIGIILYLFFKNDRVKSMGALIMGFGMIFFGMQLMGLGITPLKKSQIIVDIFHSFSYNPVLGVFAGMIMTMLVQSSSATVGIVLTLVQTGLINLEAAIPIIMGDNIGTCITAFLASLGGNLSAKRTAVAHFGFNLIGTVIVIILLPLYKELIILTSSDPMRQAANAHTIFNICNTILFLPFTVLYTKLIEIIIPGQVIIKEERAIHLSKNLLETPPVALDAVDKEMTRSLNFVDDSMRIVKEILANKNYKEVNSLRDNENIIDNLQFDITTFLVELSRKELSRDDAVKIPKLLHSINDIERMGDHGESLYHILNRKKRYRVKFSEKNYNNLLKMLDSVQKFIYLVIDIVEKKVEINLKKAYSYENKLDMMKREYQDSYFTESSTVEKAIDGMIYYDILIHLEKIGDHLINVVEAYNALRSKAD